MRRLGCPHVCTALMHLLGLFCLLALLTSAAFAQETPTSDQPVPSYTLERGYVVPTMAPPPGEEVTRQAEQKYRTFQGGPYYEVSKGTKMTRKFWRGANNLLFGWVEIPKKMIVDMSETDPCTGFFSGLGRGSAKGAWRMGVGAIEVITFWSDYPDNFKPVIQPEFVMGDMVD
jgi:putative exosortase-associated protein (TIGR04073 family)